MNQRIISSYGQPGNYKYNIVVAHPVTTVQEVTRVERVAQPAVSVSQVQRVDTVHTGAVQNEVIEEYQRPHYERTYRTQGAVETRK